jgi:hypothetical protein
VTVPPSTDPLPVDTAERHFYAVMHHLATVLWMKGLTTEGLAALSAVLEWTNDQSRVREPEPMPVAHRPADDPAGQ